MRAQQQVGGAHVCDALEKGADSWQRCSRVRQPLLNCHRKLPAALAHATKALCCGQQLHKATEAAIGAKALAHLAVKCTSSLFRTVPVPLSAKLSPVREVEERAQTGNLGAAP